MKINFLVSLILLSSFIVIVQSCLFQIVNNKDSKKPKKLDKTKYIRQIYPHTISGSPNDQCECGSEVSGNNKNWNVFIIVSISKNEILRKCHGTVIAHNLVLTSVKCLLLNGKHLSPYESWHPPPTHKEGNLPNPENVNIGTSERKIVKVQSIIHNQDLEKMNTASADDIAILVVKDGDLFKIIDGTKNKKHVHLPVCLPLNEKQKDLSNAALHRYAYHYGYGGAFPYPEDPNVETRFANGLVIVDGKECGAEQDSDFSTSGLLCVRTRTALPTLEGGPLLTTNEKGYFLDNEYNKTGYALPLSPQTAFLVGLGTITQNQPDGKQIHYAYFANVLDHLEFIEKVASEQNSKWCKTPAFVDTEKATGDKLKLEAWPWEMAKNSKGRSETLDCACGFKNSEKVGRVAGGKDAVPNEFGWMVYTLNSYDGEENELCGASIINDRVLLTAAHCVVENKDVNHPNGIQYEKIKTNALFLGVHFDDLVNNPGIKEVIAKEIIVHPGYVPSLKDNVYAYDLALIILESPIEFSTATTISKLGEHDIRPICLPKSDQKIELQNGTVITAMGWGLLTPWDEEPEWPEVLQKLNETVRDMKYCAGQTYQDIADTVFCVGNFTIKHGVTQGDSGGPLAFKKPNGQYFQVGAVSYGFDVLYPSDPTATKYPENTEWLDMISDVQQFVPFIEYYSNLHGAHWCKT